MYWRISRFQELEHIPEADRAELLRRLVPPGTYASLIARSAILGLVFGNLAGFALSQLLDLRMPVGAIVTLTLVASSATLFYQWFLLRVRGQLLLSLERAAREKRLPMCLRCGYNLEGLPGDVCPECGTRIHGSRR